MGAGQSLLFAMIAAAQCLYAPGMSLAHAVVEPDPHINLRLQK